MLAMPNSGLTLCRKGNEKKGEGRLGEQQLKSRFSGAREIKFWKLAMLREIH